MNAAGLYRSAGAAKREALIKKWREKARELHAAAEQASKIGPGNGSIASMVGRVVGGIGAMTVATFEAAALERCANELEALEHEAGA